MNKKLHKYVNEIIDLGTAANMGWKEGVNMFLSNVKNAGQEGAPHYGGADHLDWAAIGAELAPFTDADEADMINTFNADYTAHMAEIIDLRSAGDRDGVTAVMCGE
ncbi:hypothetical protein [Pseudoflavonifractor phocaeensis]|uniref:hypothetical protein n=1 Tax=Pseudoflavonifractor phocaeensis TaxID=1870988 RepID=UPI00195C82B0|nr:hypothetical protein [Pseudoflavonifractor phocaeensis]MBM6888491.1 hypothetical protein [Pseudoflavonifractor phocaeensis]